MGFRVRSKWRLVKKLRWKLIRFPEGEVFNSPGLPLGLPWVGIALREERTLKEFLPLEDLGSIPPK